MTGMAFAAAFGLAAKRAAPPDPIPADGGSTFIRRLGRLSLT
jgi:hypothetical protein